MGNTILQCFYPTISGRLFEDDFEVTSWLTDQRWLILRGDPQNSSTNAYSGVKSFKIDATGPQIEKQVGSNFKLLVCYFFDDSTEISSTQTPFVLADARSDFASSFGIGVDNGVTTDNYTVVLDGVASDSGIARTDGWHRILISQESGDYGDISVYIDGELAGTDSTASGPCNRFRIGNTSDVDDTGWTYYDVVQIMHDTTLDIAGDNGRLVTLYSSSGSAITSQTIAAGVASFDLTTYDMPLSGYFTVTEVDARTPYFVSEILSLWSGDTFTLSKIDFGYKTVFSGPQRVKREDSEANSGRNEGVFFHARDIISFTVGHLTDEEMRPLYSWWALAKQRMAYGLAIDSDDTVWKPLALAAVGGTSTITVATPWGVGVGSKYLLRRADNLHGEHIEVSAISSAVPYWELTLTSPLQFSYSVNDILRSLYYWPRVINTSVEMPVNLDEPRTKRWSFAHEGKEQL